MVLSFGPGDFDESAGGQTARTRQHTARHRDLIVPCKTLNHSQWRISDRRQPCADFGFHPGFNTGDKMAQDIIKNLDLFLAQPLGIVQEKICDLPQGADALRRRAASDGFLKFCDDGSGLLQDMPHVYSWISRRNSVCGLVERDTDLKKSVRRTSRKRQF